MGADQNDHDQDQQRDGHPVLRGKISRGEVVDHAQQQAADDRTANLVEAADDRRDERVEAEPFAVRELGQVDRGDQDRGERDERGEIAQTVIIVAILAAAAIAICSRRLRTCSQPTSSA